MNIDEFFMKKALSLAKDAYNNDEIPVGAVLVKDGCIISEGFNNKDNQKNVTRHAELIAIEKASNKLNDWRLCDTTLYVTMEPCPMCASAIQQSRIKRLVYGCSSNNEENEKIINLILKNSKYNHSVELTKNILEKQCSKIIKDFFKQKRKKEKFKLFPGK